MIHDIELHNWRMYTDYHGDTRYEIIIDIEPRDIDVDNVYGDRHLCIIKKNIDIPDGKTACRIPITIQIPDAPFTENKLTRIKRKYLVDGGAGKFATFATLTKHLDATQLKTINDAVNEAIKKYVEMLPNAVIIDRSV